MATSSTTTIGGIPEWMEDYAKKTMASGQSLAETPYSSYSGSQLAGFTAPQTQAANLVQSNVGSGQPALAASTGLAGEQAKYARQGITQAGAGTPLFGQGVTMTGTGAGLTNEAAAAARGAPSTFNAMMPGLASQYADTAKAYDPKSVSGFMNPYQDAVTKQGLDEMRRQGTMGLNQISANAVAGGAFGGARHGIAEAEHRRNMAQQQGEFINQSNMQNYGQAQNASLQNFQNQMARQAGAAQGLQGLGQTSSGLQSNVATQLGQLGGQYGTMGQQLGALGSRYGQMGATQAGIGAQLGQVGQTQADLARMSRGFTGDDINSLQNVGNLQQVQAQRGLDLDQAEWNKKQKHPYEQLNFMSGLIKGTPYRTQQMSTTETQDPSRANQLLGGLATLAGAGKEFNWWGNSGNTN
jgi:hypothetical protein